MSLAEEIKNIPTGEKALRSFGRTVGIVFLILGAWSAWRARNAAAAVFFAAALFLLFFGAVRPSVLTPVYKAWMTMAFMMGWVMTRVILTALFTLVITPIGLLLRIMGKDLLDRRFREKKDTYWKIRDIKEEGQGERYFQQF